MSDTPQTMHQRRSSIASDGRRIKVRLGDLSGRFTTWRLWVFYILIAVYAVVPLVRVGGEPLILLDILHRRFYLFGQTFNAQDAYLLFFLVAFALLSLVAVTSMFGRVWCGWACPQTVYMEGLFRKIERLIEGPKARQIQRETGPWTARKAGLLGLKHALYLVFAFLIANIFITYFVSFEQLSHWVMGDPREHWTAFVWMAAITGIAYGNFAWFREQTCLILCPYGRLQSALTDDDSITVGYDFKRGEPRGKAGAEGVGDCVNCYRCVDVCPTGIDIREGLQLECIACANCVDACDDIMRKLKRPEGLVRYASLNGLLGNGQKVLRPRVFVYLGFIVAFGVLGLGFLGKRRPFEAVLIRQIGMPYVLDGGEIRNSYVLHLVNKTNKSGTFELNLVLPEGAKALTPVPSIQLDSLDDRRLPMVVTMPRDQYKGEFEVISRTKEVETGKVVESRLRFVGP